MTTIFTPCPTGTDCSNETSINILRHLFGEVVDKLSTGVLPNNATETGFLSVLLHWFAIGMETLIFAILAITILRAVNNARDTGAWHGDNWHPVWTPMRLIYAVFMAAPLKFGFAMIHILIIMIALWGIGLANYIYKVGVIDKAFVSPASSAYSASAGSYGYDKFARDYFKSAYCAYLFNQTMGTAVQPKTQSNVSTGTGTANSANFVVVRGFVDTNPSTQLAGGAPVCGVNTEYRFDTSQMSVSVGDKAEMFKALDAAQMVTNNAKINAAQTLAQEIEGWIRGSKGTAFPVNDDPNEWAKIDPNQLNIFAQKAGQSAGMTIDTTINNLNTGGFFDSFKKNLEGKGWASMGGWTGEIAAVMSRIVNISDAPFASVSGPTWEGLPDSAQVSQNKVIYSAATQKILQVAGDKKPLDEDNTPVKPDFDVLDKFSVTDLWNMKSAIQREVNKLADGTTIYLNSSLNSALDITKPLGLINRENKYSDQCGGTEYIGHSLSQLACAGTQISDKVTYIRGSIIGVKLLIAAEPTGTAYRLGSVLFDAVEPGLMWLAGEAGFLSVVVPMLPSAFLILAVVGFFIQILQSIIAATLWMVLHSMPERSFIGSQMQGYLLLLSLLARPAMIVIGFIASLLLCDALLPYVVHSILDTSNKMIATNGVEGLVAFLASIHIKILFICTFVTAFLYLVLGLPQTLFDQVFTWLGMQIHPLGESNANVGTQGRSGQNSQGVNTRRLGFRTPKRQADNSNDKNQGSVSPARNSGGSVTAGGV